jgi:hypothetical protein
LDAPSAVKVAVEPAHIVALVAVTVGLLIKVTAIVLLTEQLFASVLDTLYV